MLCVMKPLHWNSNGYVAPAGHRASSGYPLVYGFGHEEWNNAPSMRYKENGVWYRAFHTEPVQAAVDFAGQTAVFMYASHDGAQYLVGVAAQASYLSADAAARFRIRKRVGMNALWQDAWRVALVKERFKNDVKAFRAHWATNVTFMPAWACPENRFLWLDSPVKIDPQKVRGTSKFLTMFGRYTTITTGEAQTLMNFVPAAARTAPWRAIVSDLGQTADAIRDDLAQIVAARGLSKTTREALIDARLGQGKFRAGVMAAWNGACAVTGCGVSDAVRASHIVPWRGSTNAERLDAANGLPLIASIDALFDRYLVAFEPDGAMAVAPSIARADRRLLGVPKALLHRPQGRQATYLARHRTEFKTRHGI